MDDWIQWIIYISVSNLQRRYGLFEVGGHTSEESIETPVVAKVSYDDGPYGWGNQNAKPWRGDLEWILYTSINYHYYEEEDPLK